MSGDLCIGASAADARRWCSSCEFLPPHSMHLTVCIRAIAAERLLSSRGSHALLPPLQQPESPAGISCATLIIHYLPCDILSLHARHWTPETGSATTRCRSRWRSWPHAAAAWPSRRRRRHRRCCSPAAAHHTARAAVVTSRGAEIACGCAACACNVPALALSGGVVSRWGVQVAFGGAQLHLSCT